MFDDSEKGVAMEAAAKSAADTGKKVQFAIFILMFFLNFGLQKILVQIRSLNIITHMMVMRLLFPPIVLLVFSIVFDAVSFDLIPTEYVYPEILHFADDSEFSPECGQIGYKSNYLIPNSGSISIYIAAGLMIQIFYAILASILKKGNGKVFNWIKRKQSDFWYSGLVSFFNETYLNLCFCSLINITHLQMDDGSTIGNNIFCLVIITVLFVGPIVYAIAVSQAWKASERTAAVTIAEELEGGSREEEEEKQDFSQFEEQKNGLRLKSKETFKRVAENRNFV